MPSHDAFRELAALAVIGEITAAENDELMAHLKECPECREACSGYSSILRQDLPHANPHHFTSHQSRRQRGTNLEIRERFLARARAHGAEFSTDVAGQIAAGRESTLRIRWTPAVGAAAAGILLTAGLSLLFLHRNPLIPPAPAALAYAPAVKPVLSPPRLTPDKDAASPSEEQLTQLERENRQLDAEAKDRKFQLEAVRQSLAQRNAELTEARSEGTTLTDARAQDQAEIAALQQQTQTLQSANADSVAALVQLQDRIRVLKASLAQQAEKMEMERQMAAVSSDVRQLMGARDLHIIDVHDVNGSGRSAKSFGRVFYAEGQCLVFYAFDLPGGKPAPTKLYFNAWGQREAGGRSVRNLGTFTIDDRDQHRWVLKVTDAALLKGIDSVFVTAETVGDARQPEGTRVLYAYLAGSANHP
jgi:hypothetical protein